MGSVVLVADETVAARRDVVYGLFGAGQGAGWLFAADCDVLTVGSAVSLQLPVGGPQAAVDMLGRVTALAPPRQIVIALDQPWRGQLRVCLAGPRRWSSGSRSSSCSAFPGYSPSPAAWPAKTAQLPSSRGLPPIIVSIGRPPERKNRISRAAASSRKAMLRMVV